jgi:N-acetylmuramoyl-L-alanine amidase
MHGIMISRLLVFACAALIMVSADWAVGPSGAQEKAAPAIRVRAAKHQDYIRIVVTADDQTVKNSTPVLDRNGLIVIEFRHDAVTSEKGRRTVTVQTDKGTVMEDSPVEILKSVSLRQRGSTCEITVLNIKEIKVLKLQAPSRIVIDAFFSVAQREETAQSARLKGLVDQISFRTFVIDAGHGGYDYGIKGTRFAEKDFALAFARDLSGTLSGSGREVLLTRKTDLVMSIAERISVANRKMPDLFISFHVSSTKTPAVYVIPDRSGEGSLTAFRSAGQKKREVAKSISEAIANNIEKEFSIKTARENLPLPVLVRTKSPAILIELPSPDEFNYEKNNREKMMSAILKGLAAGTREDRQFAPVQKPEDKTEINHERMTEEAREAKSANKPEKKKADKPEVRPEGRQVKK